MSKNQQDKNAYLTAAEKSETLKRLQDTFAPRIDPDVVYFILSERDYNLESAFEALLTLANENPIPASTTEVISLTDIINSEAANAANDNCEIEFNYENRQSSSDVLYTSANDLYDSNEALYNDDLLQDKRNSGNFALEFAPRGICSTVNINIEESSKISNLIPTNKDTKIAYNDINDVLSPQSDCSVEADATDIISSAINRKSPVDSSLQLTDEVDIPTTSPSITSLANRPFYYYPFISSPQSNFYPYQQPQPSNYFHIMAYPSTVKTNKSNPPSKTTVKSIYNSQSGVKLLILLRGLPGSGKSTLASKLVRESGVTCSTDYFFTHRSKYIFDPAKLPEAHEWNQRRAKKFMEEGKSPIVIDNTNIESWEMKPYVKYGQSYGYRIEILEPETSWKFKPSELALRNVHGITKERILTMLDRYERNVTINSILGSDHPSRKIIPEKIPAKKSAVDSYKIFTRKNNEREMDDPMISNFTKPFISFSQPSSPTKIFTNRNANKKAAKILIDDENLDDIKSKRLIKQSPNRKDEMNGGDQPKYERIKPHKMGVRISQRRSPRSTSPEVENLTKNRDSSPTSSGRRSPISPTPSNEKWSPISPTTSSTTLKKNALECLKDDYCNDDEDFWSSNETNEVKKSKSKETSPQRNRFRKRHSKGDLKSMEDIDQANVVCQDLRISPSADEWREKTTKPIEDVKKESNKNERMKFSKPFALPFVQYSRMQKMSGFKGFNTKCQMEDNEESKPITKCLSSHRSLSLSPKSSAEKAIENTKQNGECNKLNKMKELFPHLSEESLNDLYDKCRGNIEWASNIVLDSNHEYPTSNQKDAKIAKSISKAIDSALTLVDCENRVIDDDSSPEDDEIKVIDTSKNLPSSSGVKTKTARVISDTRLKSSSHDLIGSDSDDERIGKFGSFSDDEEINFQLHPAFAAQLEYLFGPPCHTTQPQSSRQDLEIKINLNLAWQIHKCWAKTVEKKLYNEDCEFIKRLEESHKSKRKDKIKAKRCFSLDRKRSRSYDRSESRSFSKLDKTDSVPNMSEIIDNEMAVQISNDDAIERFNKMWDDVDLATKLKRKLLYDRYPYLDRNSLDEVFAANEFSLPQTEEQIKASFGGVLPKCTEIHTIKSEGERSGVVRRVSPSQTSLNLPSLSEMDFRSESVLYHQLRQESFNKANKAFHSGNHSVASFYAQQGHSYTQKMREANTLASLNILMYRNIGRDERTIDLHLLYVREALQILDLFLKLQLEELNKRNNRKVVLAIITGRGKHSIDQVPRLKRAVVNYLSCKNITYHEKHAGLLEVVLTKTQKI